MTCFVGTLREEGLALGPDVRTLAAAEGACAFGAFTRASFKRWPALPW